MHVRHGWLRPTSSHGVIALVAVAVLGAGCGQSTSGPDVPTIAPATPAQAPGSSTPAGVVVPAPASSLMSIDSGHRLIAVASTDRRSMQVYSIADPVHPQTRTAIALPDEITAVTPSGNAAVVAVGPRTLVTIDLSTGAVATHATTIGDPTAIAQLSDGLVAVGTASGKVATLTNNGATVASVDGFVRVDELAVTRHSDGKDQVVALDRAQSSITSVDAREGTKGEALRAGNGAARVTSDHFGRYLVTNARDNQLLSFYGDPLLTRLRYPITDQPWAVGFDNTHNRAWVVSSGTNIVQSFELGDGSAQPRDRLATVRQANSMVVDDASGTVYLLSAIGDGLQALH